ncbi:MAG TPA: hypothetical protein VMT53_22135 [Terriglobales bacterium]|jgi:hypothetical protein|nr:hypothetical protein [Terriglobales bacterium]
MEPEISVQQPVSLIGFCKTVIAKRSANWPLDENAIASDFVSFFALDGLLQMQDLEHFCQKIGIEVSSQDLPKPLRGHCCTYKGKSAIVVGTFQGSAAVPGSVEHTLLHELRELIEGEFRKLGRPIATDYSDLESRAESFASHVRVCAGLKTAEEVFQFIGGIESRLLQVAAIVLVAVMGMAYFLACVNLPQWEDQFPM